MGKALMFSAGATFVLVCMWLIGLSSTGPDAIQMVALSWFCGISIGAWATGIIMFSFSAMVGNNIAKHMSPKRRTPPPIELDDSCIVVEDDEDIYSDVDWWKDEKKREKHRRGQR